LRTFVDPNFFQSVDLQSNLAVLQLFFGADITERFHAIVEVYTRKFNHKVNMSNSRSGPILPIGEGVVLDRRSTLEMAKKMSQQLRATTKT
jgi:hypothetical protein